MRSQTRDATHGRNEPGLGLGLCAAVVLGWACQQLVPDPDGPQALAPGWLPLVAASAAAAGLMPAGGSARWLRVWRAARWAGFWLMVWAANGLPFDVLTAAGLMGHRTASGAIVLSSVYWPGAVTRASALAAAVVLARLALARSAASPSTPMGSWYAYAAFLLALPYPLLRTHWALGGTLGLASPGEAGEGWEPLLIAIPWVLAAMLSLLLVSPRRRVPRRLLLLAGWSATAIVAMIGPAAFWSFVSALARGADVGNDGIATWVFGLFYGSWFLFALAAAAATRSYQVRTRAVGTSSPA